MAQLTINQVFAERYILKRMLGRGGFAEVWLGEDNITKLEVAIKVYAPGQGMDTDGMNDFCKELSNVYNLNHTNLLKPQHVDSWQGMPYLVMTYCPKGSCQRKIGKFSEEELWRFLAEVSSGLSYLHQQEIIHQDIKPDNILIDPQGNYVVTDFGISVQARATLRKSMSVSTGSGTTAYMGPERFSKDPTPIKASDIWSLGATAYELLTGDAPFGEIGGGLQKGGADVPTINKNISPTLRYVLAKMLAVDPWERPTAEQLAQWAENPKAIDFGGGKIFKRKKKSRVSKVGTTTAAPSTAIQPTAPSRHSKWLPITVIATCLIFLGAVVGFIMHVSNVKEKERIEAAAKEQENEIRMVHKNLNDDCCRSINNLTERTFIYNVDDVINKLRILEDFEAKKHPKMTFFNERWKDFQVRIEALKMQFESVLNDPDVKSRWEMDGRLHRDAVLRYERAKEICENMQNSQQKSAHDIHRIADDR